MRAFTIADTNKHIVEKASGFPATIYRVEEGVVIIRDDARGEQLIRRAHENVANEYFFDRRAYHYAEKRPVSNPPSMEEQGEQR